MTVTKRNRDKSNNGNPDNAVTSSDGGMLKEKFVLSFHSFH